jgi:peptidoglycan/LPS O-acetylase OafA/YrhL
MLFAAGQAAPGTFLSTVVEWALFPSFMPWFAAGVGFFFLHRDGRNRLARLLVMESALVVILGTVRSHSSAELPFCLAFYALFTLFVFRPRWLRPFSYKPVTLVGASSYSLYLLHQNLGVTLIATIGGALAGAWSAIIAVCVGFALIAVSVLIYRCWEMPAKRILLALGRGALKPPRAYPGRRVAQFLTAARQYPKPRP